MFKAWAPNHFADPSETTLISGSFSVPHHPVQTRALNIIHRSAIGFSNQIISPCVTLEAHTAGQSRHEAGTTSASCMFLSANIRNWPMECLAVDVTLFFCNNCPKARVQMWCWEITRWRWKSKIVRPVSRVFHKSVPHCEAEQNVNNISFFVVVLKVYYRMDTLERAGLHQLNTAVRL